MSLYFWILFLSFIIPFLYSFEKRLKFYSKWKYVIPSILIVSVPYLIWDYFFTIDGYWGFNSDYLNGFTLFSLPIEEILFFIVVPYCCVFTYYALEYYFPKTLIPDKVTLLITILIIVLYSIITAFNLNKLYTVINGIYLVVILIITYFINKKILGRFYWVFIILLVPFLIVNGILTGTGIENEIVWYSNKAITGFRVFTVPIEDFFYAFSLILANILISEELMRNYNEERSVGF